MIKNDDGRVYVTVALDRLPDGSIGVLLPSYQNRIIVRPDSQEVGGHSNLHVALAWLVNAKVD